MTDTMQDAKKQNTALQLVVIVGLLVAAFFGAYRFASARNSQVAQSPGVGATADSALSGAQAPQDPASGGAAGTPACACCGSGAPTVDGVSGEPVEGLAQESGGVQTISVDVGATYSPNVIKLKAGVPAEITFGQGNGCTAQVVSADLGFSEDLTAGPRVVKLPALTTGTYSFSCGMSMVFGKIVVE